MFCVAIEAFKQYFVLMGCVVAVIFSCSGMSPADADFQILEIARRLDLYGTRFHVASDREGAKINLSVSHMGVLVFQVIN